LTFGIVRRRNKAAITGLVLGLIFISLACNSPSKGQISDKLTVGEARQLSDGVAADLINRRSSTLLDKAELGFRNKVNAVEFASMLDQMYQTYGVPLSFEFKQVEKGNATSHNGEIQQVYKVWYAARTSKAEKGRYFLFVEVVKDQGNVRFSSFAIVEFQGEAPEDLR